MSYFTYVFIGLILLSIVVGFLSIFTGRHYFLARRSLIGSIVDPRFPGSFVRFLTQIRLLPQEDSDTKKWVHAATLSTGERCQKIPEADHWLRNLPRRDDQLWFAKVAHLSSTLLLVLGVAGTIISITSMLTSKQFLSETSRKNLAHHATTTLQNRSTLQELSPEEVAAQQKESWAQIEEISQRARYILAEMPRAFWCSFLGVIGTVILHSLRSIFLLRNRELMYLDLGDWMEKHFFSLETNVSPGTPGASILSLPPPLRPSIHQRRRATRYLLTGRGILQRVQDFLKPAGPLTTVLAEGRGVLETHAAQLRSDHAQRWVELESLTQATTAVETGAKQAEKVLGTALDVTAQFVDGSDRFETQVVKFTAVAGQVRPALYRHIAQLGSLEGQVDLFKKSLTRMARRVAVDHRQRKKELTTLGEAVKKVRTTLAITVKILKTVRTSTQSLDSSRQKIEAEAKDIATHTKNFQETAAKNLGELATGVTGIKDETAKLPPEVIKLTGEISSLSLQMNAVAGNIKALDPRLKGVESGLRQVALALALLPGQFDHVRGVVSQLVQAVAGLAENIKKLALMQEETALHLQKSIKDNSDAMLEMSRAIVQENKTYREHMARFTERVDTAMRQSVYAAAYNASTPSVGTPGRVRRIISSVLGRFRRKTP
jgi:hypothetical protein